jgi:hypothetical protein
VRVVGQGGCEYFTLQNYFRDFRLKLIDRSEMYRQRPWTLHGGCEHARYCRWKPSGRIFQGRVLLARASLK